MCARAPYQPFKPLEDFFSRARSDLPALDDPMVKLILRVFGAGALFDPGGRSMTFEGSDMLPCEMCCFGGKYRDVVPDALDVVAEATYLLSGPTLRGNFEKLLIIEVEYALKHVGKYFTQRSFRQDRYQNEPPPYEKSIRTAVRNLWWRLERPYWLLLEDSLSHRPELLPQNPFYMFFGRWLQPPLVS